MLPPTDQQTVRKQEIILRSTNKGNARICIVQLVVGAAVVQWKRTGLQVNRSSERSCTRGKIHIKIHIIRPGCLQPSIALQYRIVAYNTIYSFIRSGLFLVYITVYNIVRLHELNPHIHKHGYHREKSMLRRSTG